MAGRPKKPTALKELEGTARPDRTNPNEPKPARGASPPEYLYEDQKRDFLSLAREFNACNLLTVLDAPALAMFCELMSDYRDLKAIIKEKGMLVDHVATGGFTVQKLNPVAPQLNKTRDQILTLLREFGATPAARSKVSTVQDIDSGTDPLDDYLKNKGL